jgi:hypothetical protein
MLIKKKSTKSRERFYLCYKNFGDFFIFVLPFVKEKLMINRERQKKKKKKKNQGKFWPRNSHALIAIIMICVNGLRWHKVKRKKNRASNVSERKLVTKSRVRYINR